MSTHDAHAAATGRAPPGWIWRVALANAPFLIAAALMGALPDPLQALVTGAIVFFVPGLAWTDHRRGDAFEVVFRIVLASLAAALATWLLLAPLPGPTSRLAFIGLLAAITNAGIVLGVRRSWYAANPFATPLARALTVVAALFLVQSYLGAAHFIPALEDQDMETQGTAYGLIHELTPTMPTNRPTNEGSRLFFAHPLLLHFWIGEAALVSNDLERLRHYHEASLAARDAPERTFALWQDALAQFERDPVLLATRTPNIVLGVLIVFPLGFLVFRLSGSRAAAVGACVIYATLPEVYVRSAYGGYMAVTNFLLASGAYFYLQAAGLFPDQSAARDRPPAARRLAIGAAALGAWADQKFILLPLAAAAHALLRTALDRPFVQEALGRLRGLRVGATLRGLFARPEILAGFVIGAAFLLGWGGYALYGLAIAPAEFIEDHVREHLLRRVGDANLDLFGDEWTYPSVVGLWVEFIRHSGWPLAVAAAAAGAWAAGKVRGGLGVFLLWAVIGAAAFSLVDWRQTKHLAHVLPALAVIVAVWWAALEGRLKAAATALLTGAVLWNVWRVGMLMGDFTYIQPKPIW